MNTITLTNEFHNTSINLVPGPGGLSPRQVTRARRALCGIAGCTCGGDCGERGPGNPALAINPTTGWAELS